MLLSFFYEDILMSRTQEYNQKLQAMKVNAKNKNHTLVSSESVGAGHPDKICDQVSDLVVDAYLAEDSTARVAVETAVKDSEVMLLGEVNSTALFVQAKLPEMIKAYISNNIGFNRDSLGLNGGTCSVSMRIGQQANEIEQGTQDATSVGKDEQGAGDQGMMLGFATKETKECMPLPIMTAHSIVKELNNLMHSDPSKGLRPDNKSMVTIEYDAKGQPVRIACIVVAQQHDPDISLESLEDTVRQVAKKVVDNNLIDSNTIFIVNGTGSFVLGGPHADAGLTGRKIIVDTYGSFGGRHGGGAFSGKDPSKVDRSAAYMARYLAKQIVANGYADKAEIQLAYCIGIAEPISVNVDTFGTTNASITDLDLTKKIIDNYDLRPSGIIELLNLKQTKYLPTSVYGHFGYSEYPWEKVVNF